MTLAMPERYRDWSWVTASWSDAQRSAPSVRPGMILLNTPLSKSLLQTLWQRSWPHLVADAGASHLHRSCPELLPELVLGDFDSAQPEILESYRERGVEVRWSSDQDDTDLEKCLAAAQEDFACEHLYIAGQFAGVDGRMDHTLGAMNALYKAQAKGLNAALLSDDCCVALLTKGSHCLAPPRKSQCGLVPLGGPVHVTTHGLCWDMTDAVLEWGGLISTSNCPDEKTSDGLVWVETNGPVIWTCNKPEAAEV